MKPSILILLISLVLGTSCKEDKKSIETEENPQMEAVMAVHDEVMPKMNEISKLVAELKPMADSTETGIPYRKAMQDLQEAHQSMMDWMKGFGERFDHEEIMQGKSLSEEKQHLLDEEEVKVKAMREKVNSSIEQAKKLLETS